MKVFSESSITSNGELKKTTSSRKLSHQEIVQGLEQGDESVLGYIYHRYVQDMFGFGSQFTRDRELVKDSIHEVFASLIARRQSLEKIRSIKSYLFAAVYHRIIYDIKKNTTFKNKNQKNNYREFNIEFSVQNRLIMEESNREKLNKIKSAIKNIGARQRQAILHYYYDGFVHEEIAMIMGLKNAHSVTKLISRGLKAIRESIAVVVVLFMTDLG
ncbi:MAG: RNA polymerase sigma factor [Cytophagales bacterium]|nr:RNA polymerase sigma factor [Cytophagales bacterium]